MGKSDFFGTLDLFTDARSNDRYFFWFITKKYLNKI